MFKKSFTTLVLLLIIGVTFSQNINTAKLDSLLDILGANNKFMGSVAVSKNGKQVYTRNVGYSYISASKKILNDASTKYQIGSVTKMFTAAIIFQFIDEKKITLETKLSEYFPQIPNSKKITIKMLLGHRSGLFDFVNDIKDENYLTKKRDKQTLLKIITTGKPHFKPNSNFSYCNSGYLLLSYIIEKVTLLHFKDAVQERICNKINLSNTFSCATNDTKNNIAIPYSFNGKWNEIKDFYFPNVQGVGDIISTASDLVIFNEALLAGKLFSIQSLEKMKIISGSQFGLGIMQIPIGNKTAYGHSGDSYGTHTLVVKFEKDSLSIASINNGEVMEHDAINYAIAKICLNKYYEIPSFNTIVIKSKDLDQYLGEYYSAELPLKIKITKTNNTLVAQATGQNSFKLVPTGNNKFEYEEAGIKLEFILTEAKMILHQNGKQYNFNKK